MTSIIEKARMQIAAADNGDYESPEEYIQTIIELTSKVEKMNLRVWKMFGYWMIGLLILLGWNILISL